MILEWLAFGRELEVGRKGVLVLSLELQRFVPPGLKNQQFQTRTSSVNRTLETGN